MEDSHAGGQDDQAADGHYPYLFHIRKTAMQVARMTRQQTATITESTWREGDTGDRGSWNM